MAFQIFVDSSSDLSKELRKQYDIDYFRMGIVVNGELKDADMDWELYSPEQLYGWIKDLSNKCKTSLATYGEYLNRTEEVLKQGKRRLKLSRIKLQAMLMKSLKSIKFRLHLNRILTQLRRWMH